VLFFVLDLFDYVHEYYEQEYKPAPLVSAAQRSAITLLGTEMSVI
jgi:hypothetical protein